MFDSGILKTGILGMKSPLGLGPVGTIEFNVALYAGKVSAARLNSGNLGIFGCGGNLGNTVFPICLTGLNILFITFTFLFLLLILKHTA
jgi:hypothetical protein